MGADASGQRDDRRLDDIVRDADEYYRYIRKKDASGTRLDVAVVSVAVWFATFVVLGLSSLALAGCFSPSTFSACVSGPSPSALLLQYLLLSAGVCTVAGVASGLATYGIRRSRRFRFAQLGALLEKMKGGEFSSEEGLHLIDAMHQAALVVKKRKVDSAFEYGVVAFILIDLIGNNIFAGVAAGVLAYLYFRERALREYQGDEKRYEDSKRDLLQSL
jgi:hypothetical protein